MRKPSTAAEIYAQHRAMLRGGAEIDEGEPAAGFYWRRFVSGGPRVPVEIRVLQDVDEETGELAGDEELIAIIGTPEFFEVKERWPAVVAAWMSCARNPVTRDQFHALVESCPSAWMKPIDLREALRNGRPMAR